MKNRTRPVRIEFRVTEQEHQLIQKKMEQLGTKNMGVYLRKMAIDGYIIKVDYPEQKRLAAAVSRVAGNINQICRRINQTGHFYEDDIVELKAKQCEIWELLKQSQRAEL
ncbi:MAG: plasmid mobilization protein, partial [Acetatifactor sp.]